MAMASAAATAAFAITVKVDTHIRHTDLSMVYTNDPVMVENSIIMLKQLLADDGTYKVVGFDLEYTGGCVGHDQKYKVWGGEKKKQKDSLVDLVAAIIDTYYNDMKAECDKHKSV
ncbi:putative methyltransferase PMT27 [Hordeum vulgare]|nr:putative methyltransferase PMT27 [Hordeum vulgare]